MRETAYQAECLTMAQMKAIFEEHMIYDFPEAELKPWNRIKAMLQEGIYAGYGLFEEGELRAYAFFVKEQGEGACLLLDYYAVCRGRRASGLGSLFLELLCRELRGYAGILLESERILSARDQTSAEIRTRRIAFYQRNHCILTKLEARVYGVEYSILYLPLAKPLEQIPLRETLERIYHAMFAPGIYENQVRIWEI